MIIDSIFIGAFELCGFGPGVIYTTNVLFNTGQRSVISWLLKRLMPFKKMLSTDVVKPLSNCFELAK